MFCINFQHLHGQVSCVAMALEEGARSCLLQYRHKLEQDMKPSYLMDHMISDGVMTVDEEGKIRAQVSLKEKIIIHL